jgi:bifunctional DNA primase/polymerase-like protein
MSNPVPELQQLLGSPVVFIGWPKGVKGTSRKWGHLTSADMTPEYLANLPGGNIGVALGEKSGGLVAIDFDDDSLIEPFLALNPHLRDTLQTHGARGGVLWIRPSGDYPKRTTKLKNRAGEEIGEFRSYGSQSIIWGIHPNTKQPYQFVVKKPVVVIEFNSIKWPDQISNPPKIACLNTASCVSASLHDCIPASSASLHPLHNKAESVLANITAKKEALESLAAKHPSLARLYIELIEPYFQARAHARNEFIVYAVPFLHCRVAPQFILELVGCFYDCNRALFHDPREQHMKEAKAMLTSVAKTYAENLKADESSIYEALAEPEQNAFRICRDLALLKKSERPPLTFYLSFNHLADRLGIFPTQAQRIMRQLESYGLITLLKKGTRRAAGVRGEAGEYQWLL